MAVLPVTERTRARRLKERASYDRDVVDAILDEATVCHVGFTDQVAGRVQPFVIPTIHARVGDVLYLHGAAANHMLKTLGEGVEVCVTVTLVDGLVLARSAFHHSINYRSVCVFGRAVPVTDQEEKLAALTALVDQVMAGRSAEARPPSPSELRATSVVRLPISEASAKIRTGPPVDDAEDLSLDVWAGVLPLRTATGDPQPAPDLVGEPPVSAAVLGYRRARR
jgi:nitroimidazol reductase NimA-like FMN-containing flavoprotein (pyridoxamine 5'-phosphate oxidase superfamily)